MGAIAPVATHRALATRLLPHLERLDHVTNLEVVVRPEGETTLEAVPDLDHVVLEPTQRADRLVLHGDHVVPQQAGPRVPPDLTGEHHATSNGADLGRTEDLTDLGP